MEEFYSVSEVAQILKLSELTVRRYLVTEKLKGFKVGRFWRISTEEINHLVEKSEINIEV